MIKTMALYAEQVVSLLTDEKGRSDCLRIMECHIIGDGVYTPPKSMEVFGKSAIEALRDFLNEHYPKED